MNRRELIKRAASIGLTVAAAQPFLDAGLSSILAREDGPEPTVVVEDQERERDGVLYIASGTRIIQTAFYNVRAVVLGEHVMIHECIFRGPNTPDAPALLTVVGPSRDIVLSASSLHRRG